MHGSKKSGMGLEQLAECSDLIYRHEVRKTALWRWHGLWTPVPCFQEDCPSKSFPNSSTNWGVSIQKYEPTRTFLIQTTPLYTCIFCMNYWGIFPRIFPKIFSSFLIGTAIDFILMSLSDTEVVNRVEKFFFIIRFQK